MERGRAHAHALLRVPVERASREFRVAQKRSEKDSGQACSLVAELWKRVETQGEGDVAWSKVISNLRKVESRLEELLVRNEETERQCEEVLQGALERIKFLQKASDVEYFDVLIVDHLLRNGCGRAGKMVAKRKALEYLVDDAVFNEVEEIAAALRNDRDVEPALKWCAENKSRLRRLDSSLEFELRKFGFLLLIQNQKHIKAVQYARKYFPQFAESHMPQIQATMAALAFMSLSVTPEAARAEYEQLKTRKMEKGDETQTKRRRTNSCESVEKENNTSSVVMQFSPSNTTEKQDESKGCFAGLSLLEKDWEALIRLFETDCNRALSLEQQTSLQVTVKAGLASMHTLHCKPDLSDIWGKQVHDQRGGESCTDVGSLWLAHRRSLSCPCCDKFLGLISAELPFKQQIHSCLICRITGETITEENPPMYFPNGQIFSLNGLKAVRQERKDGKIVCPVTKEIFSWDEEVKRLFLA